MAVASEFHSNISAHLGHWSTQMILQLTPYTQKTAALLHMQVRFLANNITSLRQSGSTLKHKKQVQKCIFAKFWENCS